MRARVSGCLGWAGPPVTGGFASEPRHSHLRNGIVSRSTVLLSLGGRRGPVHGGCPHARCSRGSG